MRGGRRQPPRWIEAPLERLLGAGPWAQATLGDLAEGYDRLRARRPVWLCDLWYAAQAASLAGYRLLARDEGTLACRGGAGSRGGTAGLAADLRWALRLTVRRPLFTLGVALTLGLGIGANAAVFSVVDGTFRSTSWWAEPDRTLAIWPERPFSRGQLSFLMAEAAAFEAVGGYKNETFAVLLPNGETLSAEGAFISPEVFARLRVQPALGRAFALDEGVPGAEPGVVLSRALWIRSFGADPGILGRRIEVNGAVRTVIGIQGEGGRAPGRGTDVWLPLVMDPADPDYFPAFDVDVVGVMRPGVSEAEALADVRAFAAGMARRFSFFYPPDFGHDATVENAAREQRAALRMPLFLLLVATATLLLVAALNVGSMLLTRSIERARELAVRRALGANRRQVVRQLVAEAGLLAGVGGVAGALLATPGARALTALWASDAPIARSAWTSPAVAAFLAGAALLAWVSLAGVPILHFVATDGRGVRANVRSRGRGHRVLVGTQAALATALVLVAALLVGTVSSIRRIPLGFDPVAVSTFRLSPPSDMLSDPGRLLDLQERVVQRVGALPGVEAAGLVSDAPLDGVPLYMPVNPEARPVDVAEALRIPRHAVGPGAFEALRVPLLGGRFLDASDRGRGVSSIVVSRAMADALWPGEDPVGKRLAIDPHAWRSWVNVVGVVGDVRSEGLLQAPGPAFYVSLNELLQRETTLVVRGAAGGAALAADVRRILQDVDPAVPMGTARPLVSIVREAYGTAWVTMGLLTLLAILSTGMAALGIHAALAHDVARRRREMGVRMALGAGRGSLIRGVLARGLMPAALGVFAGLAASAIFGRLLESLLFGVSRLDPRVFALTAAAVLVAALAAVAVPAARAGSLPPAEVLREE